MQIVLFVLILLDTSLSMPLGTIRLLHNKNSGITYKNKQCCEYGRLNQNIESHNQKYHESSSLSDFTMSLTKNAIEMAVPGQVAALYPDTIDLCSMHYNQLRIFSHIQRQNVTGLFYYQNSLYDNFSRGGWLGFYYTISVNQVKDRNNPSEVEKQLFCYKIVTDSGEYVLTTANRTLFFIELDGVRLTKIHLNIDHKVGSIKMEETKLGELKLLDQKRLIEGLKQRKSGNYCKIDMVELVNPPDQPTPTKPVDDSAGSRTAPRNTTKNKTIKVIRSNTFIWLLLGATALLFLVFLILALGCKRRRVSYRREADAEIE
ncbi:hypothetical protein ECANGB1_2632 [Enterospora canceri]|uniref:Uncharacterized protein n=1 Tax=Enterospora canceri TaxID=1081671 RepID=A0A1Y1S9G7_9MICR|nr:hypothetical protein ECANGB1_2632 [Enterospora canceri]